MLENINVEYCNMQIINRCVFKVARYMSSGDKAECRHAISIFITIKINLIQSVRIQNIKCYHKQLWSSVPSIDAMENVRDIDMGDAGKKSTIGQADNQKCQYRCPLMNSWRVNSRHCLKSQFSKVYLIQELKQQGLMSILFEDEAWRRMHQIRQIHQVFERYWFQKEESLTVLV
jgi:hypothetical protein